MERTRASSIVALSYGRPMEINEGLPSRLIPSNLMKVAIAYQRTPFQEIPRFIPHVLH